MKQKFKLLKVIFLLFVIINKANSQIYTSVIINKPYGLTAKNYIQQGNNIIITIINGSATARSIRIFPSLEGINNNIQIQLKPTYTGPAVLTFAPGEIKKITLNQLQAFNGNPGINDIIFRNYSSKSYFADGNLPEGLYRLCINIRNAYDTAIYPQGCTAFVINSYDPPIILNPKSNTVINSLNPQNILFNWTPTGIPGKTQYLFKLVDLNITPVNNPNDAFKNNVAPFFQQEGIVTNSLIYDNTKPNLYNGHTYALQITAYDPLNSLLYKNNGHSQVIVFTYKKEDNISEVKKIQVADSIKNFTDIVE